MSTGRISTTNQYIDAVPRDQGRDLPVSEELEDDMTLQNVRSRELGMGNGNAVFSMGLILTRTDNPEHGNLSS